MTFLGDVGLRKFIEHSGTSKTSPLLLHGGLKYKLDEHALPLHIPCKCIVCVLPLTHDFWVMWGCARSLSTVALSRRHCAWGSWIQAGRACTAISYSM